GQQPVRGQLKSPLESGLWTSLTPTAPSKTSPPTLLSYFAGRTLGLRTREQVWRTTRSIKSGLREWVSRMKRVQLFASYRNLPRRSLTELFSTGSAMLDRSRNLCDYNLSRSAGRPFVFSSWRFDISLTKWRL